MTYDGVWKNVLFAGFQTMWLYNSGDEISSITGGWEAVAWKPYVHSAGAFVPGLVKGSDAMVISDNYAYGGFFAVKTVNRIDVGNYTKLHVHFQSIVHKSMSKIIQAYIGIMNASADPYKTAETGYVQTDLSITDYTMTIDLSDNTVSNGFVAIFGSCPEGDDEILTVDKVWLE